jgi:alkylation response protein AidB-like acyl-CoA dehydrogenase
MRLALSVEDMALREAVQAFVADSLAADVRAKVAAGVALSKAEQIAWQKALHARGWIAPSWPVEFGGTGWSVVQRCIFKNELEIAGAPPVIPYGIDMIGPALQAFGSPDQQARFLPAILSSDHWWCQGFSEPDAGSDLANLRTVAKDHGDHFRISGQKLWTSKAHYADFMFLLARTQRTERRQDGISMLILDMNAQGVTIRPITSIDGEHNLNEVFLDEVVVPRSDLIGAAGKGWSYAKYLLGHERSAVAGVGRLWGRFERLKAAIRDHHEDWPLLARDDVKRSVAQFEVDLVALSYLELRAASDSLLGPVRDIAPSLLKIAGSDLLQRLSRISISVLGAHAGTLDPAPDKPGSLAPPFSAGLLRQHLYGRAATIYGGTSEIQRDIAARALLR